MAHGLRINPENGRAWAERVAADAAAAEFYENEANRTPKDGDHGRRRRDVLVVEYDVTELTERQRDLLVGEAEAQAERTKSSGYYVEGRWVEDEGKPDVNVRSCVVRKVW